jgi:hypothetical protein
MKVSASMYADKQLVYAGRLIKSHTFTGTLNVLTLRLKPIMRVQVNTLLPPPKLWTFVYLHVTAVAHRWHKSERQSQIYAVQQDAAVQHLNVNLFVKTLIFSLKDL